jgi:hypothetical protein
MKNLKLAQGIMSVMSFKTVPTTKTRAARSRARRPPGASRLWCLCPRDRLTAVRRAAAVCAQRIERRGAPGSRQARRPMGADRIRALHLAAAITNFSVDGSFPLNGNALPQPPSADGVHHINSRHLSHRSGRFELTVKDPKRTAILQVTGPISSSTLAAFDRENRAKALRQVPSGTW